MEFLLLVNWHMLRNKNPNVCLKLLIRRKVSNAMHLIDAQSSYVEITKLSVNHGSTL